MIIKIEPDSNGAHMNQLNTPPIIPDGWVEIPQHFEAAFIASGSFCDLVFDGKTLVDITPLPIPGPEPVPLAPMTTAELSLDLLTELNYRTTLLELGMTT